MNDHDKLRAFRVLLDYPGLREYVGRIAYENAEVALAASIQPEAQGEAEDFHDILYGAKLKILLDPENDSSAVSGCVGATFGSNDGLEIMLHAVDADGGVVKLHTAAPKPVEGVTLGADELAFLNRIAENWRQVAAPDSDGEEPDHGMLFAADDLDRAIAILSEKRRPEKALTRENVLALAQAARREMARVNELLDRALTAAQQQGEK